MADDLEKPALSCRPCSEKLPMVLSSPSAQPVIQVPASIAQYLRNYQREGVRFLYQRYKEGEGAILADDMGLGKTIQAIAFISAILLMKGTKDDKLRHLPQAVRNEIAPGIKVPSVSPVLVICPASLSDNWVDELQTWGYFSFFKISSSNKFEVINKAKHKECDVLITTFEFARSSIDLLNTVEWACVLADEVHRIKDPTSQISKALNSLHCNSRFGFTGTPYQNNMEEMWCLFNWSNPRAIRKLSNGTDEISRLVEHGMKSSATKREASDSKMAREKFSLISAKCLKRRCKELLAKHLPAKTDQIVFCELTDVQKNIYRMISQSPDVQMLLDSLKDTKMKGSLNKSMKKKTGLLFTYLHLLQKTANYVGLLVSGLSPQSNETTRKMCLRALEDYAGVEGIPQKRWLEALSDVQMSGKMLVLSEMIPAFMKNGDKILLFSYSTKVLDFVQNHLRKMRYKHWRLDGTTPAGKRFALVKSFNTFPEPAIFLLSTKAGGVGLNMTGANVVIIFDPNWNPAHDLQAQDRAYRLGQDRDVRVYRLLSTSTIEEFVYLRQVYKQQLGSTILTERGVRRYFDSVPGDRRYYGELFGIRNLFSFRETSRSLTEELLEKQRQLEQVLRIKVEAPSRQGISQAQVYISPCAITINSKDEKVIRALEGQKSGLNQLCEDIFESPCDDPIDEGTDNDDYDDDEEEEEEDDDDDKNVEELNTSESGIPCGDTISALLERTGVVRHVLEHQEVIAPSTMESFVTNCAVRDVLHKGINSQVPAFQCSLGSEDDVVIRKHDKRKGQRTDKYRLMFDKIAGDELLTPLELARKVVSMSTSEKQALLNRYLKGRQTSSLKDNSARKRARCLSETIVEKVSSEAPPSNESLRDVHAMKFKGPLQRVENAGPSKLKVLECPAGSSSSSVDCIEMGDSSEAIAETQRSSSQSEFSSSSFENDASLYFPDATKDAILLVKGLISPKVKKASVKIPKSADTTKSSSTKETPCRSNTSLPATETAFRPNHNSVENVQVHDDFTPTVIDSKTGLSVEAVQFFESLLYSNDEPKPSPKNAGFIKPTFRLPKVQPEKPCSSQSSQYDDLDISVAYQFEPEDDIYTKMLASGKLKRV